VSNVIFRNHLHTPEYAFVYYAIPHCGMTGRWGGVWEQEKGRRSRPLHSPGLKNTVSSRVFKISHLQKGYDILIFRYLTKLGKICHW